LVLYAETVDRESCAPATLVFTIAVTVICLRLALGVVICQTRL
jgi:hypothetical protein